MEAEVRPPAGPGEQPTTLVSGLPAPTLRLTLSGLSHPVWKWVPSGRAWARYEGAERQNCESYARTRALLERAIATDPDFAEAHAELASAWTFAAWMACVDPKTAAPKARTEAERAIQLDQSNATAHLALARLERCHVQVRCHKTDAAHASSVSSLCLLFWQR